MLREHYHPMPLLVTLVLFMAGSISGAETLTVRGRVIDAETRKPLRQFNISAEIPASPLDASLLPEVVVAPRAIRSRSGSFSLTAPRREPFALVASAPGYLPAGVIVTPQTGPVTIPLSRGVKVEGTVRDAGGRPLGGVSIAAEVRFLVGIAPRKITTTSAIDGTFSLSVDKGDQTVMFAHDGFVTEQRSARVQGEKPLPLSVMLYPATEIRGSIVDDRGEPLPGARVRLSRDRAEDEVAHLRDTMTDHTGQFAFAGIRTGSYTLTVQKAAHVRRQVAASVPAADPLKVVLDRGATVRGFVRGSTDAERSYVFVYIGTEVMTAINLKEEFGTVGVPPGRQPVYAEVQVSGAVRRTPVKFIETRNGETAFVELDLIDAPEVTGLVRVEGGSGPGGVVLEFVPRDATDDFPPALKVATDDAGSFRVTGLPAGTYDVNPLRGELVSPETITVGVESQFVDVQLKDTDRRGVGAPGPAAPPPPRVPTP